MTFRKILCPTDFSQGARRALEIATRLAVEDGAELVVLHSWYIPPIAFSMEATFPAYVVEDLADQAQKGLDAAVAEAIAAGAARTTGVLRNGVPWSDIVTVLDEGGCDLCVIGTHGRSGLARFLLGSVTEKVIRHAPCSVLAVRPDSKVQMFSHALVPTDFSDSAAQAVDLARSLVRPDGTLTLLHVLDLPVPYSGEVTEMPDFARDLDRSAAEALAKAAHRIADRRVTTTTRIGSPGPQALAAAEHDPTIDLVVTGSHGRTGIRRVLLGSVAEKVVRNAKVPVLVARKRTA